MKAMWKLGTIFATFILNTQCDRRPMYNSLHIMDGFCYYQYTTMKDGEARSMNVECERWTCSAQTFELIVDGCPPEQTNTLRYIGKRLFWPDCCNETFTDENPQYFYDEYYDD
uniref:Putative secreted protein n=1 Tax=Rhipicephalus microplus TaxID=6941 RepID=A0A6G5A7T1_RHIMP